MQQKMAQEIESFRQMHARLWEKYPYQFVAIYQGKLIDHDQEQHAILLRIDKQYSDQVVLIRQVRPEIEPVYTIHSTRFVNE